MASTGVYSTAPNVAPIAASGGFAPTVLATASIGPGVSPGSQGIGSAGTGGVVAAGPYLVGGSFSATRTVSNWAATDYIQFSINNGNNDIVDCPQIFLSGNNSIGTAAPYAMAATVTGMLILPTAQSIAWWVSVVYPSGTGYDRTTITVANPYYIKIG